MESVELERLVCEGTLSCVALIKGVKFALSSSEKEELWVGVGLSDEV